MNSPTLFRLLLELKIRGIPIARSGKANAAIFTLNPMAEIIHAVTVVPMFAPIMTPILWAKVIKPAFTKLTTITVVALELCISAVTRIPVNTPMTLLRVMEDQMLRRRSPANFSKPSLMIFIPYRNTVRATCPRSGKVTRPLPFVLTRRRQSAACCLRRRSFCSTRAKVRWMW